MADKKITFVVPEELAEAARQFADDLPGYAAEAFARRVRNELLAEEVRRYEEEHGAFTAEEMAEADARLRGEPLSEDRAT
ncbi:hypothetical protein [Streptomyces sp. NPDC002276]